MAVNFKGTKPAAKPSPAPIQQAAKPTQKPAAKTSGLSFLKRGAAAQKIAAQEEKKAELRQNQVYRYYLPKDGSGEITFLDGDLQDGILDIPYYHEHQVNMNNSWKNWFICTQDEEPCPVCEGGGSAGYVGIMTVIDHSEWDSKDGKHHKDEQKLFVAKRDTIKDLQKKAVKRDGLRGCRFEVSRTGDKSASVGSSFEFTNKLTEKELVAKYKDKAKPVDYEEYLKAQYMPASELRKLGFGSSEGPVGSESGPSEGYDV